MAHNIHIPWTLLSSQFSFLPTPIKHNGQTNFYHQGQPKQGLELMHFSHIFTQTISSSTERTKYPNPTPPPEPDNIIISEQTAKKISKTVIYYRNTNNRFKGFNELTLPERQMKYGSRNSAAANRV
jgi:hypothetical protein